jgi:hypothetical protein
MSHSREKNKGQWSHSPLIHAGFFNIQLHDLNAVHETDPATICVHEVDQRLIPDHLSMLYDFAQKTGMLRKRYCPKQIHVASNKLHRSGLFHDQGRLPTHDPDLRSSIVIVNERVQE